MNCRYGRPGTRFPSRADLFRAIEALEGAIAGTYPEAPTWPTTAAMLASALRERYQSAPTVELKDRIDDLGRQASETSALGELPAGLTIWRSRADWSASTGDWPNAAAAYLTTVNVGRELSLTQWTREDKESWIRELQGVGALGAYAMVNAGRVTDAALILELSSAVLLAEALERRDLDLASLARRCGDELPTRYREAIERVRGHAILVGSQHHVSAVSTFPGELAWMDPGLVSH